MDAAAIPNLASSRRAAARTSLAVAAATLSSRLDRYNRRRRNEAGDRRNLSLFEVRLSCSGDA